MHNIMEIVQYYLPIYYTPIQCPNEKMKTSNIHGGSGFWMPESKDPATMREL